MDIRHCLIGSVILLTGFFVPVQKSNAQINLNETFKTNTIDPNIILGGSATLTSPAIDPLGDGWLRLTSSATDQKGYMYVNKALPSFLGVFIDFEYKTWRDAVPLLEGGDGFTVTLSDALAVPFSIGGFGGSLGYAPNPPAMGLYGAYIGIGFDEFGNFSNPTQGRIGGPGRLANSITIRGEETNIIANTHKYLTHTQLQPNLTSSLNSIGYPNLVAKRPSDGLFYRRVKISIIPSGSIASPKYTITVRWRTSPNGNDVTLITHTTTTPPPANLILGFAASTGGSVNYHEIRNLVLSSPIGFSVYKNVDNSKPKVGDKVTYTVNVLNSTVAPVTNLLFTDSLKLKGILTTDEFTINSITFNDNGNANNTAVGYTSGTPVTSGLTNPFSTSLSMQANSSATFTVVGTIKDDKSLDGLTLKNVATIDPSQTGIPGDDLSDNSSAAVSNIAVSTPDLQVETSVDKPCADPVNGNTYTILVSNVSMVDINKTNPVQIIVTDTIPAGFTFVKPANGVWTASQTGNVLTFSRKSTLLAGASFEPIVITVKPPTGGLTWTNTAYVSTSSSIGELRFENNKSSVIIARIPPTPILKSPIVYNQGDIASPLFSAKNLVWYSSLGSRGSTIPPIPSTSTPGTTSYYISQSNGNCESSLTKVDVIVVAATVVTACDSYTADDGKVYMTSGMKTVLVKTSVGNDSIFNINLILKHSTTSTIDTTVCDSYTAPDNSVYKLSGIYNAKILNVAGCDSTITINLTVKHSSSDTISVTACDLYTASDGTIFTDSGIKKVVIPNVVGCDSIIVINLTIGSNNTETISVAACDSYTAPDGFVYIDSGIKTAIIKNKTGCDSTITINLTVNRSENLAQTIQIFKGESYSINGNTYDKEGTYSDILKTKLGCDSVVVTELKYIDVINTITPNGDGIHDRFMENYRVKIYNRNGVLLFDGQNGWDGTHKGKPVLQDTYFYILYLDSESKTKEGYVTVVR